MVASKKKRYIVLMVMILYTLIIMLPPLVHGYVYPNNGDDSSVHLVFFDAYKNGTIGINGLASAYWGRLIGCPIVWINKHFGISIDSQFLWFNYIVLWLVGISVFILLANVVDWKVGLLAIPMVMFCTPSMLNLFDTGAIFDLLTVGVVLPLAMLCFVYSIIGKKLYWIIPTVIMMGLAIVIHSMVIFKMHTTAIEPSPSIPEFLSVFLGIPILMVLLAVLAIVAVQYKDIKLEQKEKILLAVFSILVLAIIPLSFSDITAWATRFTIELAIVLSIFATLLLGVVLKRSNQRAMTVIAIIFVLGCSMPMLTAYCKYNSAVKPVDLEAISYVNSLPGEYFSCSPEVAPLIYNRFLNKAYKEGALPYIKRSKPMTSWTTPSTRDYWWGNSPVPDVSLDSAVRFGEGNLVIYVVR